MKVFLLLNLIINIYTQLLAVARQNEITQNYVLATVCKKKDFLLCDATINSNITFSCENYLTIDWINIF